VTPGFIFFLTMACSLTLRADFSYATTVKSPGGAMAAATPGMNRITKTYLKGQKMKIDSGSSVTIFDFDAQTSTVIDSSQKTYRVTKFSDMSETLSKSRQDVNVDVKDTGQKKTINGYNASEMVLSVEMDNASGRQAGAKMHMEVDFWISSDVPGAPELRAFYQRNAAKFPWGAMAGDGGRGNQSVRSAMVELLRKMADMKGVPVLEVIKMGAGNDAQQAQMQQGMAQARARLEEMRSQGKLTPQMEEALKRMNAASSGGSLFETTMESTDFSASPIPDSMFAIPAGYQQTQQ
jgi:Domain of unknown function (DUF4412)